MKWSKGDWPGAASGSNRPRSYREAVLDYLARSGQDRTPEDLLGVVVFAGSSMAVSIPSASTGPDIEIEYQLVDGSNIDTALRFAQRMFPPDAARRIVLVSDGVETGGDALRAAGLRIRDEHPGAVRVPGQWDRVILHGG